MSAMYIERTPEGPRLLGSAPETMAIAAELFSQMKDYPYVDMRADDETVVTFDLINGTYKYRVLRYDPLLDVYHVERIHEVTE